MQIFTFTDAEIAQISSESPTFATKVAGPKPFPSAIPSPAAAASKPIANRQELEANACLDTIRRKNSPARCVELVRAWAKEHGYSSFATLAGAKRLVAAAGQTAPPENEP